VPGRPRPDQARHELARPIPVVGDEAEGEEGAVHTRTFSGPGRAGRVEWSAPGRIICSAICTYVRRIRHMTDSSNTPFSALLADILGSPARLRVARLLVRLPEKEFTGREIARLLGLSPSTALAALGVLVSSGLARQRAIGRAYAFQANRDSYLFAILDDILASEDRIREELLQKARSTLGRRALSIVLFGSYARGTAGSSSDLDLLVVTEGPEEMRERVDKLEALFLRRYGLHVDAKILTPRELRAGASLPYIRAARAGGIVVGGKPLDEVIGRGS